MFQMLLSDLSVTGLPPFVVLLVLLLLVVPFKLPFDLFCCRLAVLDVDVKVADELFVAVVTFPLALVGWLVVVM